ncbi:TetR family transcriptional regulator [Nocardioides sp. MAH-18]|uniref:TetR family transcriptional regulator n=1 Tax=Nocardioides agri TaxID=2682843 RepID=A0A6L6XNK7_9ACTN|nr:MULTISPECIES: TetR/AcrR family transcriptional regulator [unclassified Nocardioides]MBA2953525.1 TetR/AcrR family transcriptional regulator [Nocardioides sp. CGMCC 1.13656]MVQ48392.1 TetR family transcriptional regulator [Nocardioides sp. MAH-18]
MPEPIALPLVGAPPPERRDAARNRELLLDAATALIERSGPRGVTMDAVAQAAGVGKGTVFRRFESREGLMAAVLNHSEAEWQLQVMSGPPPLGPGADPWDRLLAFGRTRLETTLLHAELIREAGRTGARAAGAYSFTVTHVRYLLTELGVRGDLPILATALLAPLELPILDQQVNLDGFPVDRVHEGWVDLARRIVGR